MGSEKSNPARVQAAGLGDIDQGQPIDSRENSANLRELQAAFLVRRFPMSADHAHLVAMLAFDQGRQVQ